MLKRMDNIVVSPYPDYLSTRIAYHFASLVHPARDIITKIKKAYPGGNMLPRNLRGWRVQAKNGYGKIVYVELGRILNSIIHMQYISVDNQRVDVENDNLRERYIVDRHVLFVGIERLLLEFKDICLTACALAEKGYTSEVNQDHEWEYISPHGPWYRDLAAVLRGIRDHPQLANLVWCTHFARSATPIGSRDIINHVPFNMTTWQRVWQVGWRRDGLFASPNVQVSDFIKTIRDYASNP